MSFRAEELLGKTIARKYQLARVLGRGGMAVTFAAKHLALNRWVAVKVTPGTNFANTDALKRFVREIRALSALTHPRIVRIIDAGTTSEFAYYVMDYLSGGSIEQARPRLENGTPLPMGAPAVYEWLAPIADVLDYIHSRNLVHRDVKPSNILLDDDGNTYLADFGLVKVADALGREAAEKNLTAAGLIIGTPRYVAPEIVEGQSATPQSDQYSLGVVAYELLAGRPPFSGSSASAVMIAHVTTQAPPLLQLAPTVPASVATVVERALAKNPADRFPSCRAFMHAFQEALMLGTTVTSGPAATVILSAPDLHQPAKTLPRAGAKRRKRIPAQLATVVIGACAVLGLITMAAIAILVSRYTGGALQQPGQLTGQPAPAADRTVSAAKKAGAVGKAVEQRAAPVETSKADRGEAEDQPIQVREADRRRSALQIAKRLPELVQSASRCPLIVTSVPGTAVLRRYAALRWVNTLATAAATGADNDVLNRIRIAQQQAVGQLGNQTPGALPGDAIAALELKSAGQALAEQMERLGQPTLIVPENLEQVQRLAADYPEAIKSWLVKECLSSEELVAFRKEAGQADLEHAVLVVFAPSEAERLLAHHRLACRYLAAAISVVSPQSESTVSSLLRQTEDLLAADRVSVFHQMVTLSVLEARLWGLLVEELYR